jgi:hypothetical protein
MLKKTWQTSIGHDWKMVGIVAYMPIVMYLSCVEKW